MASISLPGLPSKLLWLDGVAGDASVNDEGELTIVAGKKTDWFSPPPDPSSPAALSNAPALVFAAPDGDADWQLSARVTVDHRYLFDAGTIFVHQGKDDWCKLCFEYSPERLPLIVSVVTRGVSDDANGASIQGSNSVHLRVSKYGTVVAFHYSTNGGGYWTLHRAFCMREPSAPASIGFLAQSPTGEGCTASFSGVQFSQTTLTSLRDGS